MTENKLQFRANNPGAVQFGNFINYYNFHPPENRLKLLPTEIWPKFEKNQFTALDLGCNSGDLTLALYDFLIANKIENCRILGVDLDPVLIKRAQEKNDNKNIDFLCLDFMDETKEIFLLDYLNNLGLTQFDAVFCFSITMWIHLNHGDGGLEKFLGEISKIADLIVIEPQPWKCYKSAVKRLKQANHEFPFFKQLKVRDDVEEEIEKLITQGGKIKVWESAEKTEWERKIQIFRTLN